MSCKHEKHSHDSSRDHAKPFTRRIQLVLADSYGVPVPVPNTENWINLTILKEGSKVTIQFPCINFVTGQFANDPYEIANPVEIGLGVPAEFATYFPLPQNGGILRMIFKSQALLLKIMLDHGL